MRLFGSFIVSVSLVGAASAGVSEGRDLSERWCAECHVVSPEQTTATAAAPSFAEIARRREAEEIRRFLADPHPPMARLVLSRQELSDLVGYIESQGD